MMAIWQSIRTGIEGRILNRGRHSKEGFDSIEGVVLYVSRA